jgi:hypothetical protein
MAKSHMEFGETYKRETKAKQHVAEMVPHRKQKQTSIACLKISKSGAERLLMCEALVLGSF